MIYKNELVVLDEKGKIADIGDNPISIIERQNQRANEQAEMLNPAVVYLENILARGAQTTYRATKGTLNLIPKLMAEIIGEQPLDNDYLNFNWSSLRFYHINLIINNLRDKNFSESRINGYVTVIKGVAKEARKLKQLPMEDYLSIAETKGPKINYKIKDWYLKATEIKVIMDYYKEDRTIKNIRDLAIFSLLLGCGLRRAELCSLKVFDIQPSRNTFKVLGKGNKVRSLAIPIWAEESVNEWLEARVGSATKADEFLFVQITKDDNLVTKYPKSHKKKPGEPKGITGEAIAYMYKILTELLDIEAFSPHDLRGTFATNQFFQGTDINTIRKMLGHSSTEITKLYDRRSDVSMLKNWENSKLFV